MTRQEFLDSVWADAEHMFNVCFADHEGIGHMKKSMQEKWSDDLDEIEE